MEGSATQRRRKHQGKGAVSTDSQEPTGSSTAVAPRRTLHARSFGRKLLATVLVASVFALGGYVSFTSNQSSNPVVRRIRAIIPNLGDDPGPLEKRATAGYTCDPTTCVLPNCFCPTNTPPGGLAVSNTPQFVLLTFDDAVQVISYPLAVNASNSRNPNGCRIPATFFVSNTYTNYHMVQMLHAAGHEIAIHTMNHVGNPSSAEIDGCRKAINAYSGVPLSDIKGFRAPFLEYNMTTYAALQSLGVQYDCSNPVNPPAQLTWPYTFDNGFPVDCNTGTCDYTARFPGLWEVPMNTLVDPTTGTPFASMDPPGDPAFLRSLFQHNFRLHWENGRLPFGVWLHPAWFLLDPANDRIALLNEFFDWARTYTNNQVWFVTPSQLIEWVQNPVGLDSIATSPSVQCSAQNRVSTPQTVETCNGLDDNGNGRIDEGLYKTCPIADYYTDTCYSCPSIPPTPQNPVPPPAPAPATSSSNCTTVIPAEGCQQGRWTDCRCVCIGEGNQLSNGYCRDAAGSCKVGKTFDFERRLFLCPGETPGNFTAPSNTSQPSNSNALIPGSFHDDAVRPSASSAVPKRTSTLTPGSLSSAGRLGSQVWSVVVLAVALVVFVTIGA